MREHEADLDFPNCCACCPYLREVTASCAHDLRQSLVRELAIGHSCPVYTRAKTDAMRQLTADL